MVSDTDARALLKAERISYWLGVGAQPSVKVKTLIKKYGAEGTHAQQQQAARQRLSMPRIVPDAGEPVYVRPAEGAEAPASTPAPEAAAEPTAGGETAEETTAASE